MSESLKRIYLVRHGETAANVLNQVTDKTEPLNDSGQMQASKLAERLSELHIDHIIVSDHVRAQQTAAPIARVKNVQPAVDINFGEIRDRSDFVGVVATDERIVENWRERNQRVEADPHWRATDEESTHDFFMRVQNAITTLETHESQNILVVSHGFFLSCFLSRILLGNEAPSALWVRVADVLHLSNTGISYLTYNPEDGVWRVVIVNDHAHFAE